MSKERSDQKAPEAPTSASAWSGEERRGRADRRSTNRRLDERRKAGIGEIMGERREQSGRRRTDRRERQTRRATD